MNSPTMKKLRKLNKNDFDKLYIKKLKEMEVKYDREKYCCESESDVLELFELKIEELNDFLKRDENHLWSELINTLENEMKELNKIFEMFLLARENHMKAVRSIGKYLQGSFKDSEIKIGNISDNK